MSMYKKGDRVQVSALGRQELRIEIRSGVVVQDQKTGQPVRVRWDGYKTPMNYSVRFIEREK